MKTSRINGSSLKSYINPNLLYTTQSEIAKSKKANEKFIKIVVVVKKKFGMACFHFLYLNKKRGRAPSKIQKNEIPPTRIIAL